MSMSGAPGHGAGFSPSGDGRLAYEVDRVEAHLAWLAAERERLVQEIAFAQARLETLYLEHEAREEEERAAAEHLATDAQSQIADLERTFSASADALRLAAADDAARIVDDARRAAEANSSAAGSQP